MPQLTLIRGLPGSGKSTLAAKLVLAATTPTKHLEADMFFMQDGKYNYIPELITRAHNWCFESTSYYLNKNFDVIVSNTFVQLWQMQNYIELAKENNWPLSIIECKGQFGNIHNVPELAMQKFKNKWENFPSSF